MFRNIWPMNKLYNLADMVYALRNEAELLRRETESLRNETELLKNEKLWNQKEDSLNLHEDNLRLRRAQEECASFCQEKIAELKMEQEKNDSSRRDEIAALKKVQEERDSLQGEEMAILKKTQEELKESHHDDITVIERRLKSAKEQKAKDDTELWLTKYGYDWMISDLQMAYIERVVPGNKERLLALKDTHKGEKCFVIGTGPSLLTSDLNALMQNNVFCFAGKQITRIFEKTDWRPNIWGVSDLDYIQKYNKEISALKGFPKVVCAQTLIRLGIEIQDAIYYPFIQMRREPQWFNADIMRGVHFWGTITCKLINFAVYMGFKTIYLLGVDNTMASYIKKNSEGEYVMDEENGHFSEANYKEDERELILKDIDEIRKTLEYEIASYKSIKWHCDQLGVKILNATRGGKLEVFPRVSFDEIF